jgi:two-component system, OmpR family, sensor histidine kinase KdpD
VGVSEPRDRPDPDALLRRLQQEESRSKRGKLRVFFGFAPGVGKTYRMLQVARDLVSDQRLDLVVGIVETHRRRETAALVLGLELLPRRQVEYRGHVVEEFDLDAALVRRPKAILVDELAHTNAAGTRHPKRWQDVEELLNAGIDVFTTVNVQHVESLNDVIAQITHIQVRETVPDSVLDAADAVELVDIAPEELLERLKEGKVYLPDQAKVAAEHFFQRGNLLALRELALRRTAQHVDDDVLAYRQEQGLSANVPAGERILVCVGPSPTSGHLIRAAARLAAGLRCPWVAAYVEASTLASLTESERERIEEHLRVAESLGASATRLTGIRVADALLTYARRHNVSRIVIGKPTHSRLRDRLRGSLLDEVVRGSGDIDIQVISGTDAAQGPAPNAYATRTAFRTSQYVAATALVGVTLGAAAVLHSALALPDPEMLFLLTVMVTAVWFGRGPSLYTAALGIAAYDFFFVPPYFTFAVADRRYILTFATMFAVGFVLSELAGRVKRQEREALSREERTAVLYALSNDLSSADISTRIADVAARRAADVFAANAFVLLANSDGVLSTIGASPADTSLEPKELVVSSWAFEHQKPAGFGTDTLPGSLSLCAPLRVGGSALGVLALVPHVKFPLRAEQRVFLEVFCRQVAVALERARLAEEARIAALRVKTEEMRSSLLSAVSHDLRTPLASITGAATSLRDDSNLSPAIRVELVGSICDEAERLERLVANLLDMTRLESGALSLKRDWIPIDEIIGSALTRLEVSLSNRQVRVELPSDLPLLRVDPVLFEQIFINLIENACKYTPLGTPIDVRTTRERDTVLIEFRDYGPGIPVGCEEKLFEKFYRGSHTGGSGAGLGLPICRGIAEAHGGSIRAENAAGAGALFRIIVPIGGEPPDTSKPEAATT